MHVFRGGAVLAALTAPVLMLLSACAPSQPYIRLNRPLAYAPRPHPKRPVAVAGKAKADPVLCNCAAPDETGLTVAEQEELFQRFEAARKRSSGSSE